MPSRLENGSGRGMPPAWFVWLARLLPVGILGQFVSAGLGLFMDGAMLDLHATTGFVLSLPVLALLAGTFVLPSLRFLVLWMAPVLVLYVVQIMLAAGGGGLPLALHPANGALLLTAGLAFAAKVEAARRPQVSVRRRSSSASVG